MLKTRIMNLRNASSPVSLLSTREPLVVEFDEEPDVLSMLLAACYGDQEALPADLTGLAGLLVGAEKYGMVRVARCAGRAWDEAAVQQPLEAYFIALAHGLKEHAKASARIVLTRPIAEAFTAVMDTSPALSYHRLLVYYDACCEVFRQRLTQASARIPDQLSQYYACGNDSSSGMHEDTHYTLGRNHCRGYVNVRAANVVTPLKHIASTTRLTPGANLRNTFCDTVIQAGVGRNQSTDLSGFAAMLIQCVVAVPDEIDKALDDVRQSRSITNSLILIYVFRRWRSTWVEDAAFSIVSLWMHGMCSFDLSERAVITLIGIADGRPTYISNEMSSV